MIPRDHQACCERSGGEGVRAVTYPGDFPNIRQGSYYRMAARTGCHRHIETGAAMQTFNIHEAKTHLSRLIEKALHGEPFVIAKAGRPLVKVVSLKQEGAGHTKRLGFLAGQVEVPEDFDRMGSDEIAGDRRSHGSKVPGADYGSMN